MTRAVTYFTPDYYTKGWGKYHTDIYQADRPIEKTKTVYPPVQPYNQEEDADEEEGDEEEEEDDGGYYQSSGSGYYQSSGSGYYSSSSGSECCCVIL
jgi:hypothetical protein